MSIRKDKIVVIDLEATCWQGYDAPPGQKNEIIEVGICLLHPGTGTISGKRSILVTPTESIVSEFCTDLTSLTQTMVDQQGVTFAAACHVLESEYDTRNRLWASWGSYDRRMFAEQCRRRQVRYPLSKKHANLKRVFQDAYGTRLPMRQAMTALGLEIEGRQHRGHDDAWNTARLLDTLLRRYGAQILKKYGW